MTAAEIADKWGFWLRDLQPGASYPYSHIRGHYRVPMFSAGALECVQYNRRGDCTFKMTALGEEARELARAP